jgi:hypothetical protein
MDFFKSDYYYDCKIPKNPHKSNIEENIINNLIKMNKIKFYR